MNNFDLYLSILGKNFQKICRLDFLQPDMSVAFSLGNEVARGFMKTYDTRAFLQDGTLNVSYQDGIRRTANLVLDNRDNAFDYAFGRLWFGTAIRLLMGIVLPDGTPFYLPQGLFYIKEPKNDWTPKGRSASLPLVDKWAALDGSLGGTFSTSYQVGVGSDIYGAIRALLALSRFDYATYENDVTRRIDPVAPIFPIYYDDKVYKRGDSDFSLSSSSIPVRQVPFTVTENDNAAGLLLQLANMLVASVGYDASGALRLWPTQSDISDADKPVLYHFSKDNAVFSSFSETAKNTELKNDVLIVGEGLSGYEVWGRAENFDAKSDANINRIGRKTLVEENALYWNASQCADLAAYRLKKQCMLQKSVSITCGQMFHLSENCLVSVQRTDKPGAPTEAHLISSFSLPIGQTGAMQINAVSVNDFPDFAVTRSASRE